MCWYWYLDDYDLCKKSKLSFSNRLFNRNSKLKSYAMPNSLSQN